MYFRYVKRILTVSLPTLVTYSLLNEQPLFAKDLVAHIKVDDGLQSALVSFKKHSSKTNPDHNLKKAIKKTQSLAQQFLTKSAYPGLVVGVSVRGVPVYVHGFGYSNIETNTKCSKDTVMRIASISKPLTMLSVAKLVELGKIDLDKDIRDYLGDNFPIKEHNGKPVKITTKQLASHQGGIRHYKSDEFEKIHPHYLKATDAMELFKNDNLVGEPGSNFYYSTYGYTIIAAVVESVLPKSESFGHHLERMCHHELGMTSTYLDENKKTILNRAAQYQREGGTVINSPYTDSSYKWAGGGILSTAPDLLRFGNIMLYSYLDNQDIPGFLKKSTVETLWTPIKKDQNSSDPQYCHQQHYAIGWGIFEQKQPQYVHCASLPFKNIYYHTGEATEGARDLWKLGVKVAEYFSEFLSDPQKLNENLVMDTAQFKQPLVG